MLYTEITKEEYYKETERFFNPCSYPHDICEEGIELCLYSLEDVKKADEKLGLQLPNWIYNEIKNIGKTVNKEPITTKFIGFCVTFEDIYYILKKDDCVYLSSCVGGIDF